ncbi:hypothetical protein ACYOEI_18990 [Singulisphaera rosea]
MRYDDGLSLAVQGRKTGAIYLWGYCAEMCLKAAYFSLTLSETTPIAWGTHLQPAIHHARTVRMIAWPGHGAGHNVRAWAELLVAERAATPGKVLPQTTSQEIQVCGQRIGELWNESLRYHINLAYQYEVTKVRLAAEWLLVNLDSL